MKTFDYKNCIKKIEETGNWHLYDNRYNKLKKEWIKLVIKIIESNIKEVRIKRKDNV